MQPIIRHFEESSRITFFVIRMLNCFCINIYIKQQQNKNKETKRVQEEVEVEEKRRKRERKKKKSISKLHKWSCHFSAKDLQRTLFYLIYSFSKSIAVICLFCVNFKCFFFLHHHLLLLLILLLLLQQNNKNKVFLLFFFISSHFIKFKANHLSFCFLRRRFFFSLHTPC